MLTAGVLIVCVSGLVSAMEPLNKPYYDMNQAEHHFEEFIKKYSKTYADEQEKQMRFETFKEKLNHINELNAREPYAVFDLQPYSDLPNEEIMRQYTGPQPQPMRSATKCKQVSGEGFLKMKGKVPEKFDWSNQNVVTRVKYQRYCGSSWAFATIGILEGQYAMKHKKLVEFSEQQLVDCDSGDKGCTGGSIPEAASYLVDNGAMIESDYPYTAIKDKCMYNPKKVTVNVTGCSILNTEDEELLKVMLYHMGPLGVVIDIQDLLHYQVGVLENCKAEVGNHNALLVGYGFDSCVPYWKIKNSWSEKYGDKGYVYILRGRNVCGISDFKKFSIDL